VTRDCCFAEIILNPLPLEYWILIMDVKKLPIFNSILFCFILSFSA